MSVLKIGDKVRVKRGAYNIADHRFGMYGTVTRIDSESKLLPIRVEYDSFCFNWTNYESLELIEAAPSQHAAIGKDILDKMVELKASIVARDEAVKLVVEQTEALDALLASVGLKRGEEIPAVPVRVPAGPRTALDDVADKTIREGMHYRCTSTDFNYFTEGKVYTVTELDHTDNNQPLAFEDNDDDANYPERHELKYFVRVI
jgi:hypothetical protein